METKTINGINAINLFIFYIWNYNAVDSGVSIKNADGDIQVFYVPEVIIKAEWGCSTQHMLSKWLGFSEGRSTEETFLKFYAELSSNNRVAMLKWILANYHGTRDIA